MKKILDDIDELFTGTLSDMHGQAVEYTKTNPGESLESIISKAEAKPLEKTIRNSRYSLMAVAASFALVALMSVLALITWQGTQQSDSGDKVKTAKEKQETVTTIANNKDDTPQTTSEIGPVTTKSSQSSTTTAITTPPSNTKVIAPSNFQAYDHYKNAFGWYVKLRWTASTTPGVSYCYFIDPNRANNECAYDANFSGTSGDFSVGIGNTDVITFYLRAIDSNGQKSEIVTVTYQIPS